MGARLKSSLLREREGADREHDRIRSRGKAHLRLDPAIRDVSTFCFVSFPLPQLQSLGFDLKEPSSVHPGGRFSRHGQSGRDSEASGPEQLVREGLECCWLLREVTPEGLSMERPANRRSKDHGLQRCSIGQGLGLWTWACLKSW